MATGDSPPPVKPAGSRAIQTSLAAGQRLAAARRWLAGDARRPTLVLAASRRAGQQLLRATVAEFGPLLGVQVLTLPQFAAELNLTATVADRIDAGASPAGSAALAAAARAPLTPLAAEAMVARALARCRAAAPLAYFETVAAAPGLPRALHRTLLELRHHSVSMASLEALGPRGADLARLLAANEEELDAALLADVPGLLAAATAAVEATPAKGDFRYAGQRLLLVDLGLRSPREQALVAALVQRASAVLAVAPAADHLAVAALSACLGVAPPPADEAPRADEAPAADEAPPTDEAPLALSALQRARAWVFSVEAPPAGELDGSLVLVSSPGEGAECVEIARRLLALARTGVPFDRCGILLRDPERYQPLLEEALGRAAIPALFTRGVVRPHPAGRALLALLDCALEGLSANRFAEYLSFGQVPPVDAAGAPPVREVPWAEPDEEEDFAPLSGTDSSDAPGAETTSEAAEFGAGSEALAATAPAEDDATPVLAGSLRTPLRWERLLVEAAVIGGLDRWRRRLAGLRQEMALQATASETQDPARVEHLRRDLERLATLERFALPLIESLAALPAAAHWREWLDLLERLAARALLSPLRVLQTLAELRPMAEVGPVGISEVRQALADRLTNLRASPAGPPHGRVFVGTLDEARGRSLHTVFVPGLVEGVFPRKALEDPLLLDADRAALGSAHAAPGTDHAAPSGLPTQPERAAEERLLLSLALGCAETGFVASYPTLDGREGRVRVPSFYALDLARAAAGELPNHADLMRQAAAASAFRRGWPAPLDPQAAIDTDEYGLAVLAPLLAAPAAEARGAARFLLRLDPALDRSLRARWRRWSRAFTPADGLVDPSPAARAALAAHALTERPYSATALQDLAACPYRFFLRAIQGLRPRDEAWALEELDPLTKGEIFHVVQADLLSQLRRLDRLPLPAAGSPETAAALDLLDQTFDRVTADYAERLAPALPQVWASEIEEMRIDLRGWILEYLVARAPVPGPAASERWLPANFELAFGLPPAPGERRDPASRRDPVTVLGGRLRLRGAIDFVEVTPGAAPGSPGADPSAASAALVRATDWKTGRAPDTRLITIGHGETLQPLLYALAAQEITGLPARAGRLAYCTRRGGYRTFDVALQPLSQFAVEEAIGLVETSVAGAFLPAAPRAGACSRCDYRMVCGPWEELRITRKKTDRLQQLHQVRKCE